MKVRDKVNNELFDSFVDFRKPDSYNVKWGGNRTIIFSVKRSFVKFNLSHKDFTLGEYHGKEGIEIRALRATSHPSRPVNTQFVFIGLLKSNMFFSFKSPRKPDLILTYNPPSFETKMVPFYRRYW